MRCCGSMSSASRGEYPKSAASKRALLRRGHYCPGGLFVAQIRRERGHRGVLEELHQRQPGPERRELRVHLDDEQRVPAQIEEVVVGAHAIDLERAAPDVRDVPLD